MLQYKRTAHPFIVVFFFAATAVILPKSQTSIEYMDKFSDFISVRFEQNVIFEYKMYL